MRECRARGPKRAGAALVLFAVACGGEPRLGASSGRAPDPQARGPFAVGVTTVEIVDQTRENPRTGESPRVLRVEIWYPAEESARELPRDTIDLLAAAPPEVQEQLAGVKSPLVEQDAARDAAPRADQKRFPLVLFSHGNAALRTQSVFLTTHLASHGYIVVAPDHAGNTMFDQVGLDSGFDGLDEHIVLRPQDMRLLLDLIESEELTGGFLDPLVDLERVGVTGHSFGAFTSMALVSASSPFFDDRVDTAVPISLPIAPLDLVRASPAFTHLPTFYVAGTEDVTTPYEGTAETCGASGCIADGYRSANPPKGLVAIRDVGHLGFTNLCLEELLEAAAVLDIPEDLRAGLEDGCGPEYAPPDLVYRLTNRYVTAWFNVFLRDSEKTWDEYLAPARDESELELFLERH